MAAPLALAVLVSIAMVFPVAAGRPSAPAAVAAIPPVSASALAAQPSLRQWSECLQRVNDARRAAGRVVVSLDARLGTAATAHSAYQAQIEQMTHVGIGSTDGEERMVAAGYPPTAWAENVAAGQGDCASVVNAWLNSTSHRTNILNNTYRHIGIGNVVGANGVHYWTMDLAV